MIDSQTIQRIHNLIDQGKFSITVHAQEDILKQNHNWSVDFIKECLKKGKLYSGRELYADDVRRHERYYCVHKHSIISINLVLICFIIEGGVVIIHMQPLNRNSK